VRQTNARGDRRKDSGGQIRLSGGKPARERGAGVCERATQAGGLSGRKSGATCACCESGGRSVVPLRERDPALRGRVLVHAPPRDRCLAEAAMHRTHGTVYRRTAQSVRASYRNPGGALIQGGEILREASCLVVATGTPPPTRHPRREPRPQPAQGRRSQASRARPCPSTPARLRARRRQSPASSRVRKKSSTLWQSQRASP
jgi:hypothetical protein